MNEKILKYERRIYYEQRLKNTKKIIEISGRTVKRPAEKFYNLSPFTIRFHKV